MLGPTLRGEKISLQPAEVDDLSIFRAWFANPDITRYLLMRFAPSEQQEQEWYQHMAASDTDVGWKIVADGVTIGTTAIHKISWINRHGSTGMLIGDRAQWGKGYASEAVQLRTAYGFDELGLEMLESESFVDNLAMHRALEKSGYQKIGCRRHAIYRGGVWHDEYLFQVLRDEWRAGRTE